MSKVVCTALVMGSIVTAEGRNYDEAVEKLLDRTVELCRSGLVKCPKVVDADAICETIE